ncbi:uncharacterized protein LOC143378072 [Andrena cerasifolii]|uniref:uncharacterized protein LOC143378072 n=1 Tax=Andrena cerasifolii TaxID=2819439 RepID=UPI00403835DB
MTLTRLIILLALQHTARTQELYRLTRTDLNPGLYFEKINAIRFQRADWRFIIVIDIDKVVAEFPYEAGNIEQTRRHCTEFPTTIPCDSYLRTKYLTDRVREASELQKELMELSMEIKRPEYESHNLPKAITRRNAPFGFIGSISHALFGTLDSDDSEYINKEIDKIYADQRKITQLVKNQTHIIISDLHNVHKTFNRVAAEVKTNRQKILDLVLQVDKQLALNYSVAMSQYSASVETSLNHYITTTQRFITALSTARNGKLHPSLLSGSSFKTIINEIHNSMVDYELPIPRDHQRIEDLVKISRVNLKYITGKIVVTVQIPLVNRIEYDLYKLHVLPIPQYINSSGDVGSSNRTAISAFILPEFPYLGISTDHSKFFGSDNAFIDSCTWAWHYYICPQDVPLQDIAHRTCETSLLLQPDPKFLRLCNIRIMPYHIPSWRKLTTLGGWLYSFEQPEPMQILCGRQKNTHTTIVGTGILEIHPECFAKTRYHTLLGSKTYLSKDSYYYIPNLLLNISLISPEIYRYSKEKHTTENLFSNDINKLERTSDSLYEIEAQIEEIGEHHRARKSHLSLTYGSIAVQAVIVIGLMIYHFWNPLKTLCRIRFLRKRDSNHEPEEASTSQPAPIPLQESNTSQNRPPLPIQRAMINC